MDAIVPDENEYPNPAATQSPDRGRIRVAVGQVVALCFSSCSIYYIFCYPAHSHTCGEVLKNKFSLPLAFEALSRAVVVHSRA